MYLFIVGSRLDISHEAVMSVLKHAQARQQVKPEAAFVSNHSCINLFVNHRSLQRCTFSSTNSCIRLILKCRSLVYLL